MSQLVFRQGTISLIATILVMGALPIAANARPSINIHTDRPVYDSGDVLEVSLSGENLVETMWVDVYVGLLTPSGELWTMGDG
ncbi:hypothetical protein J7M28_01250 [bacterium]|nr:hypothetical protein [bacterium]